MLDTSIPAVKAALHRGRDRLRETADEPDDRPLPRLSAAERLLLDAYIDRFNARDFDAVRDMLAEEVRLELVARTRLNGRKEVGHLLRQLFPGAGLASSCPASSKAGRRSSSAIPTTRRRDRPISSCWPGRTAGLPPSAIFATPATSPTAPNCSFFETISGRNVAPLPYCPTALLPYCNDFSRLSIVNGLAFGLAGGLSLASGSGARSTFGSCRGLAFGL